MKLIHQKWNKVVNTLERIFDEDLPDVPLNLRNDVSELTEVDSEDQECLSLFSQLSNYFELGFLFEPRTEGLWRCSACFANGQTCLVDDNPLITLPRMKFDEVKISDPQVFLQKMNLNLPDPFNKLSALLFQPNENVSIVIITRTAEPWLEQKTRNLRDILLSHQSLL